MNTAQSAVAGSHRRATCRIALRGSAFAVTVCIVRTPKDYIDSGSGRVWLTNLDLESTRALQWGIAASRRRKKAWPLSLEEATLSKSSWGARHSRRGETDG